MSSFIPTSFIPNGSLIQNSGNCDNIFVENLHIVNDEGGSSLAPGGPDTSVQFNNNSLLDGSNKFTFDGNSINVGNSVIGNNLLGFFEKTSTQQTTNGNSLESIITLLQNYGLSKGPLWTQTEYNLIGSGYTVTPPPQQGTSVALSNDGTTLAIGGPYNDSIGAVWVFIKNNTGWVQQAGPLIPSDHSITPLIGNSISLSYDGNTLAISSNFDSGVWIFVRDNTGLWSQQGLKIVSTPLSSLGRTVSLSGDGNTLAVGDEDYNSIGAVWMFTRSGTIWSQQGGPLTGTDNIGHSAQGRSISLSGDGNTLAIGGPFDDSLVGALWIFVKDNLGVWTQQGDKITSYGSHQFGIDVSISENGNILAIKEINGLWIYGRNNLNEWRPQILGLSSPVGDQSKLSLNSAGDSLVVITGFGFSDNFLTIFKRIGITWTQLGNSITMKNYFKSVAMSGDGNVIATGSPISNSFVGSTVIYEKNV